MENFRPGVMDKLGIGYAALSAVNPRPHLLCDLRLRPDRPGTIRRRLRRQDIQAMSGIMSITGHEETGPTRAGFAVLRRAVRRDRCVRRVKCAVSSATHTGKGQMVDVLHARGDAGVSFGPGGGLHRSRPSSATVRQSGREPQADRQLFKTGEGYLLLAVNSEKQYRSLMAALGPRRHAEDPRFLTGSRGGKMSRRLRAINRGSAIEEGSARVGERSSRRQVRPCAQHLEGRRGDRSPADIGAPSHSGDRHALWPLALRR